MRSIVVSVCLWLGCVSVAQAFCGFYVAGADAELKNNATMVVMMREGTKTVLSMQNDYQGPAEDFAMVVPVPIVLREANVRTLPRDVFDRVDQLAAPRLVEYWEQDPCPDDEIRGYGGLGLSGTGRGGGTIGTGSLGGASLVTVEAEFAVGEYDIVILGARDSSALDAWLREHGYSIPQGAGDVLRPYVEEGMKFFVAKVNVDRVTFEDGRAILSPLRVWYDDETFRLPVRLGLLNSPGKQDLVVHVLGRNQRYEVANYPNVTIPTNLDVTNDVRTRFGEFYAALFDRTVEQSNGAVVTEYAWQATNCDPCPGPVLSESDLTTLGADVILSREERRAAQGTSGMSFGPPVGPFASFVLTRLHYRYSEDGLGEDLVFRASEPIVGGREWPRDATGALEKGARHDSANNFQGRYVIRHPWEGDIDCAHPQRGIWGGPPESERVVAGRTLAATDTALVPRGNVDLGAMLKGGLSAIGGVQPAAEREAAGETTGEEAAIPPPAPAAATSDGGCGCSASSADAAATLLPLLVAIAILRRRR